MKRLRKHANLLKVLASANPKLKKAILDGAGLQLATKPGGQTRARQRDFCAPPGYIGYIENREYFAFKPVLLS